jgi:O-antigen ligase
MLPSPAVRAAGERVWPALGAAVCCFCAIFFSGGFSDAPLVWIGALVLLLAAALVGVAPARLDGPTALFLGSLFGLTVWTGFTILWSVSPDRSWSATNRTLVYTGFAVVGVLAGAFITRARLAQAAALLLGLLCGWALLAKCIPALYPDYGRVARLRSPLGYWNELALLCVVGVPVALWLASVRRRVEGVLLLYLLVVTLLLTYSRFGVALACLTAAAWVLLDKHRVESLAAVALGGGAGAAAFGIALAVPGITTDGEPRSVRVHDGWVFALVLIAGAALVVLVGRALAGRQVAGEHRARIERAAGLAALVLALAGLAVSIAFAGRIWNEFTNPSQITSGSTRLASASSSNRWTWWQEAWHAFTRHPFGGTGAATFELTDRMLRRSSVTTVEPHNMPLQFLSETGIVGFLLYLGVAAGALWGAVRARRDPAALALGIGVAAFFVHGIVDFDWSFVAATGPMLLVAGALLSPERTERRAGRPLFAIACLAVALAGIYSIAAPWLAERDLPAVSLAQAKRAHAYNPLSVYALMDWAAYEDAAGNLRRAEALYRAAVRREPENAQTWYALGAFYFDYGQWKLAYEALNNSYTFDRFGPAAKTCGLLDQAREKAFGYTPPGAANCPGARRASSP